MDRAQWVVGALRKAVVLKLPRAADRFLLQTTPVWRAGPQGPKTLCNACGVRWGKVAKRK